MGKRDSHWRGKAQYPTVRFKLGKEETANDTKAREEIGSLWSLSKALMKSYSEHVLCCRPPETSPVSMVPSCLLEFVLCLLGMSCHVVTGMQCTMPPITLL